jgi:dihydroxyacetone kinase-like protein
VIVDGETVSAWMAGAAEAVAAERDRLTRLDADIGDGDHGANLSRGLEAVTAALAADPGLAPGRQLVLAGRTLVSSVGGASGPLWGSALRRAGRVLGDAPAFGGPELVAALEAALGAVVELGQAGAGDKTMVDALEPAVAALRDAVAAGAPPAVALGSASEAAARGALATVPMRARRGRASYLGERSIGHEDPGAASTVLIVRALERAAREG